MTRLRHPIPVIRFSFLADAAPRFRVVLRRRFSLWLSLWACVLAPIGFHASAITLELAAGAQVDSSGVLVRHVVPALEGDPAGELRVADAPAFGKSAFLQRAAVAAIVAEHAPDLVVTNWAGAQRVAVKRASRVLGEEEVRVWLTDTLQREQVRERGELELRLTRAWTPASIPDEPLTFRLVDVPQNGVSSTMIVRFEAMCGTERVGTWQAILQAKVWRDVLVASSTLRRGQPLAGADVRTERRDVLQMRDFVPADIEPDLSLELTEAVMSGQPVPGRAVRARPAILRGAVVDALVSDGAMTISLKVEAMQDAAVGQTLRVRNLKTRREMLGKVQNEQTIVLHL